MLDRNKIFKESLIMLKVVAGAQFLSKDVDNGKQMVKVEKMIIHEEFHFGILGVNDICLIMLETPLTFDEFVGPVMLPEQGETVEGTCFY